MTISISDRHMQLQIPARFVRLPNTTNYLAQAATTCNEVSQALQAPALSDLLGVAAECAVLPAGPEAG